MVPAEYSGIQNYYHYNVHTIGYILSHCKCSCSLSGHVNPTSVKAKYSRCVQPVQCVQYISIGSLDGIICGVFHEQDVPCKMQI